MTTPKHDYVKELQNIIDKERNEKGLVEFSFTVGEDAKPERPEGRQQIAQVAVVMLRRLALHRARHRPVGTINLFFDGMYTRFSDLDQTHDDRDHG